MKLKKASEQTVVITGASSGIGLATATEYARRGARVVIGSRDETDLEAAAEQIRQAGGEVEAVAVDVGDRLGVEYLAQRAVERFGGFDTWVNNAAVSSFGLLRDVPEEDARQIMETNYFGYVHGSLVAAEHFRQRTEPTAGAIVNVGSAVGDRAIPLQGHYVASKHAIKGFTDVLRMELAKEGVPAVVTLVKPGSIATPYPEHAGNYMEAAPTLPPPVYAPEVVARTIVAVSQKPTRDVYAGGGGAAISAMASVPALADKLMVARLFDQQKRADRPANVGPNTVQDVIPNEGASTRGDVPSRVKETSLYTWLQLHPLVRLGLLTGLGLGAVALGRARRRSAAARPPAGDGATSPLADDGTDAEGIGARELYGAESPDDAADGVVDGLIEGGAPSDAGEDATLVVDVMTLEPVAIPLEDGGAAVGVIVDEVVVAGPLDAADDGGLDSGDGLAASGEASESAGDEGGGKRRRKK